MDAHWQNAMCTHWTSKKDTSSCFVYFDMDEPALLNPIIVYLDAWVSGLGPLLMIDIWLAHNELVLAVMLSKTWQQMTEPACYHQAHTRLIYRSRFTGDSEDLCSYTINAWTIKLFENNCWKRNSLATIIHHKLFPNKSRQDHIVII